MTGAQKRSKLEATEYAYRLLSFRDRSVKELKERMRKAGFSEESVAKALRKAQEAGYVNDERFAKSFVEGKRMKGFGRARLQAALKEKGIKEENIQSLMRGITDEDEIEKARFLISRRMKTMHGTIGQKEREKLRLFLLRKGYSYFIVSKALKPFLNGDYSEEVFQ